MAEELDLFADVPEEVEQEQKPADLLGPYGKRARLVRINPTAQKVARSRGGDDRLRLNFFPQGNPGLTYRGKSRSKAIVLTAILRETTKQGNISVSLGSVVEDDDSWLTMVPDPDAFSLTLNSARHGLFEVEIVDPEARLYVVRQLDESKLPSECGLPDDDPTVRLAEQDETEDSAPRAAAVTTINLLIVYTPTVRRNLGTDEAVRARAAEAVVRGNETLANSALDVRLNLVGCEFLPNYREPTSGRPYYVMLDQLERGTAAGLGGLHQLRRNLRADLVSMLVADQSLGGLANRMGRPSTSFAPYAYSVVNYRVAASTWTLVHELGHSIGCCHETACYNPRPYGRGHSFRAGGRTYKTVMVRKSQRGTRIPYFSNPQVSYRGVPTGRNDRNNASVIRDNAPVTASFY